MEDKKAHPNLKRVDRKSVHPTRYKTNKKIATENTEDTEILLLKNED